jgi:hypothetical protein
MNVNILGKGLIPGLRMLAPIKNVDLDQQQIARILKVRTLKVTLADSPDLITPNNLAAMFAPKPVEKATKKKKATAKQNTPAETLIEKAVDAGIEVAVEEKKEEEVVEETTTTPDEVLTELSSDITLGEGLVTDDGYSATTTTTDETTPVEETAEEVTEEDKANTISKKNKKNRRNK